MRSTNRAREIFCAVPIPGSKSSKLGGFAPKIANERQIPRMGKVLAPPLVAAIGLNFL
jgi:hypothetical protein